MRVGMVNNYNSNIRFGECKATKKAKNDDLNFYKLGDNTSQKLNVIFDILKEVNEKQDKQANAIRTLAENQRKMQSFNLDSFKIVAYDKNEYEKICDINNSYFDHRLDTQI